MLLGRLVQRLVMFLVLIGSLESPSKAAIIQPTGALDFGFTIVSLPSNPTGTITYRPRDSAFPGVDEDSTTVARWVVSPNEITIEVDNVLGPDLSIPGYFITRTRGLTFMVDSETDYLLSGSLDFEGGVVPIFDWRASLGARPVGSLEPVTSVFSDVQLEQDVTSWNTNLGESGPGDGFRLHEGTISGRLRPGVEYSISLLLALGGMRSTGEIPHASARYSLTVVPEPSAVFLVGTGLAALAASRLICSRAIGVRDDDAAPQKLHRR